MYDVLVGINLLREGLDLPEVTLVAILDADKEGFLRSAWSLIQMIGRAARNTGGEVVMYADRITESMKVAIDETDRRRAIQERFNDEHGIEPQTIIKGIRDINDRLRAVAENTVMYSSERRARDLEAADQAEVERLVAQDGGRDEGRPRSSSSSSGRRRCATRSSRSGSGSSRRTRASSWPVRRSARRGTRRCRPRSGRRPTGRARAGPARASPAFEVTEVTVLPSGEEPVGGEDADEGSVGVAAELFPGIRDEHDDDDGGWQARWLDRPTWDRTRHAQHPPPDRPAPDASHPRLLTQRPCAARLERPRRRPR